MKNTFIDNNEKYKYYLEYLGLLGKDFSQHQSGSHLFYDQWLYSPFKEGTYNGMPWSYEGEINFNNPETFLDKENKYRINSKGFRSEEFKKETELVFSGCSFSFGVGIPENAIWGVQIANKLNLSCSNLSIPGDSVMGIINNIYQYFNDYGHPKVLLCLFPDFYRTIIPENSNVLVSETNKNAKYNALTKMYVSNQEYPKYSKLPHKIENVISPDISFYYSMQYIKMLEKYCKSNNIKFLWSTWSKSLYGLLSSRKEFSNYFVYLDSDNWEHINKKDVYYPGCSNHEYLKKMYPKHFDSSTDTEDEAYYNKLSFHSGAHKNMHWAESFLEKLEEMI